MLGLAKFAGKMFSGKITLQDKPVTAPEPEFTPEPRPAIGFLALLSDEQRKLALSLDVNDCIGSRAAD